MSIMQLKQFDQSGIIKPFDLPDLSAYVTRNTDFESVDIFDNIVSIEIKNGIVHTRWGKANLWRRLCSCVLSMRIRRRQR